SGNPKRQRSRADAGSKRRPTRRARYTASHTPIDADAIRLLQKTLVSPSPRTTRKRILKPARRSSFATSTATKIIGDSRTRRNAWGRTHSPWKAKAAAATRIGHSCRGPLNTRREIVGANRAATMATAAKLADSSRAAVDRTP